MDTLRYYLFLRYIIYDKNYTAILPATNEEEVLHHVKSSAGVLVK